mgnify:CR=1 FL=1
MMVVMGSAAASRILTDGQAPHRFSECVATTPQEPWLVSLAMSTIMLLIGGRWISYRRSCRWRRSSSP